MSQDWHSRLTAGIAAEVRRYRKARKMSVQSLADRCEELGYPIPRPVLSNLETGRRESITVAELLVLSAALDVPPVLLGIPLGAPEEIEILPGQPVSTWHAARWWEGRSAYPAAAAPTNPLGADPDESLPLFFEHAHDELVYMISKTGEAFTLLSSGVVGAVDPIQMQAQLQQFSQNSQAQIRALRELRQGMRDKGFEPPTLPPPLAAIDSVREESPLETTA
jgi:transcriptional regulator with XRE-family HTH domain